MRILERILDLLFPPKCPFCGRVLEHQGICGECRSALPWTGEGEDLWDLGGEVRCAAPLWYEGAAREGILRLKFHAASAAAQPMGELVAQCAARYYAGEFDTVTYVPVSHARLRRRGYDQSRLLAQSACRLWGTRPQTLLVKTRDNPPQSGLHEAAARRANVLGVYEVPEGARVAGRRILIVDDVCTTGSTLKECARVLQDAGAQAVMAVAVARTPEEKTRKDGCNRQRLSV